MRQDEGSPRPPRPPSTVGKDEVLRDSRGRVLDDAYVEGAVKGALSDHLPVLDKTDFQQINLPDQSYRWAVIRAFKWTGSPDDPRHLIDALRAHPTFKDHYCAPEEDGVGDEPLHGPYRLDAVNADDFKGVTEAEAQSRLDEWLVESGGGEDEESQDSEERAAVEEALRPVRDLLRRGEVLFLPYLGKDAEHEWGWVLWHFREWLVIDREGRQLYEIACGLD